jgi:uncharacterized protein YcbK (DUF882 family)
MLKKGKGLKLSPNLNQKEVDCKCSHPDCTFTIISDRVIESFQDFREDMGKSLKINSAFRCQRYNTDIGGKQDSRHKKGLALDISAVGFDIEDLAMAARDHFDYVQIYYGENFIHCHVKETGE